MREEQKLLLVADESSLFKIYGLAIATNLNLSAIKVGAVAIAGIALSPAIMIGASAAVGVTKGFLRNKENLVPTTSQKHMLDVIKQSLGLGISLNHMTLEESRTISLGMGQLARNNSFYISHPINSDVYIPLNNYDKFLAKEKNNVFMELAAALGAKSIYLEDASFYNAKGNVETDFSVLKPVAMDIGINANFEKDGSIKKEIHSSFNKSRRSPMVPTHLQKWVDIDSDLGLMVSHRLNNGLSSHQISLHFSDSLEGAVDAAAKITGTNKSFGLKASARKYIASTWVFKVEYHSMNDE